MQHIEPITFTSINDIAQNITYYSQMLLDKGVIVFRGAHLSDTEQDSMQLLFGAELGFYPNKKGDAVDFYDEDHARVTRDNYVSKEGLVTY
jgi:hypothetical protein